MIAIVVVAIGIGSLSSNKDAPTQPGIDSRTGRPTLDVSKPLWVIAGAPICPTNDEIDAWRQHAPNACIAMTKDIPVAEMEMSGFLLPTFRVRFLGSNKGIVEAWVPIEGLRN